MVLSACLDEHDQLDQELHSKRHPLFSGLAPHHRLALLAEVAEGLLCPAAPPPPDTLEHHAAFLYLFERIQDQIDFDIDGDSAGSLVSGGALLPAAASWAWW